MQLNRVNDVMLFTNVIVSDIRFLLHLHHSDRRIDLGREREMNLVLVPISNTVREREGGMGEEREGRKGGRDGGWGEGREGRKKGREEGRGGREGGRGGREGGRAGRKGGKESGRKEAWEGGKKGGKSHIWAKALQFNVPRIHHVC